MLTVTFYRRANCPSCDQAHEALLSLQESIPHRLVVMEVDQNPALREKYADIAPVVEAGPYRLQAPFTRTDLVVALGAARDRQAHLEAVGDPRYAMRYKQGHTLTGADQFSIWLSNHYTLLFNLIVLFYVGLPFAAPVFMKIGWNTPGRIIYTVYGQLCHQLAYRSWFLFGEQPAYPDQLAHVSGLMTFEQLTGINPLDTTQSREFIGNQVAGFKVAFCERDVALYGGILLFGLIFAATGRRLRSLPWYLWVLIGILPIAIDGVTQLTSLINWSWLSWLPVRESTPFLRTLTGGLFGITTAWYGYPYVEGTMRETRAILAHKVAVIAKDRENA